MNEFEKLYTEIEKVISNNTQNDIDRMIACRREKIRNGRLKSNPNEPVLLCRDASGSLYWIRHKLWFKTWEEMTQTFRNTPIGIFYDMKFLYIDNEETYNNLYKLFEKYYKENNIY